MIASLRPYSHCAIYNRGLFLLLIGCEGWWCCHNQTMWILALNPVQPISCDIKKFAVAIVWCEEAFSKSKSIHLNVMPADGHFPDTKVHDFKNVTKCHLKWCRGDCIHFDVPRLNPVMLILMSHFTWLMTCRSYTTREGRFDSFVGVGGDSCTLFRNLLWLSLVKCVINRRHKSSYLPREGELNQGYRWILKLGSQQLFETFPCISAEDDWIRLCV